MSKEQSPRRQGPRPRPMTTIKKPDHKMGRDFGRLRDLNERAKRDQPEKKD